MLCGDIISAVFYSVIYFCFDWDIFYNYFIFSCLWLLQYIMKYIFIAFFLRPSYLILMETAVSQRRNLVPCYDLHLVSQTLMFPNFSRIWMLMNQESSLMVRRPRDTYQNIFWILSYTIEECNPSKALHIRSAVLPYI